MRNVASKLKYETEQLEELYERTAWKLEENSGIPGSSYDLFKKAVTSVTSSDKKILVFHFPSSLPYLSGTLMSWQSASLRVKRRRRYS